MGLIRDIDDVVVDIMSKRDVAGARIVGVDGPSGSGKSTLARKLVSRIPGAGLVEIDDFVSWPDFAGWWTRFETQVLQPILDGRDAHYQARDWAGDEFGTSLAGWKTLSWSPVVVVEGVTCTRRTAAPHLAYSIWVETPEQYRLDRGIARDGEDHRDLWLTWMRAEREFFAADETKRRADLRVDGAPTVAHDPDTQVVTQ
jgi:uridine kinase